jgi:hypothetical protein
MSFRIAHARSELAPQTLERAAHVRNRKNKKMVKQKQEEEENKGD